MSTAIYTIGFAGKTAREFFKILRDNGIATLVDIRLNNTGQLAGFAKARDLEYFLDELAGITYIYYPLLAPAADLLSSFRAKQVDWVDYQKSYQKIMRDRKISTLIKTDYLAWQAPICLLCSEPTADKCHRRLAADFIAKQLKIKKVVHL
ncbi:MAG: DUF488 domain-containing protein [Candidatus Cloacimonadaceae bacterium]|nr:DUF488 domain-containing protein [Candidatus Cloacimonadaceae bacterium]MDP3115318.1 DUF488 domain-containing protein [Candidatus Cloacimonadaceae bacterium]